MQPVKQAITLRSLPIVAASMGNSLGVRVIVGGTEAYTDGKTIHVPSIPPESPHIEALWGLLAHEAAHVRFTDFSQLAHYDSDLAHSIGNILEDGMIERDIMQVYPGTRGSLRQMSIYFRENGSWMDVTDTPPVPEHTISGYILFRVLCDRNLSDQGDLLGGYLDRFRERFVATLPPVLLSQLDEILDRAHLNRHTSETTDMALEIIELLKQFAAENDQQSVGSGDDSQNDQQSGGSGGDSQGDQRSDGSGDDSQGGQQSDGSGGDSQGDQRSDGSGDNSQGDQRSGGFGGDSQGDQQGGPFNDQRRLSVRQALEAGDSDQMAKDVVSLLRDALEAEAIRMHSTREGRGRAAVQASVSHGVSPVKAPRHDDLAAELDRRSRSRTVRLRQQLHGLVQSQSIDQRLPARRGRKIDGRRLARIRCGDTRVFNRTETSLGPDTTFMLLVDRSASMNAGLKASMAAEATYSLALSLESIAGVSVTVSSFGGRCSLRGEVSEYPPVEVILGPDQPVRTNAGYFPLVPEGHTPLCPGLEHAAFVLSSCRSTRRVVIVLTDGAPSDYDAAMDSMRMLRQQGIELYGIGIEELEHPELFQDSVLVGNVDELGHQLFSLARRQLIRAV